MNKQKIKVGDTVERLEANSPDLKVGERGIVTAVMGGACKVDGKPFWHNKGRVKLVAKAPEAKPTIPFNAGDRIEVTKQVDHNYPDVGALGTVVKADPPIRGEMVKGQMWEVAMDKKPKKGGSRIFLKADEMKLVGDVVDTIIYKSTIGKTFEPTGSFRMPRPGEWYVGADDTAYMRSTPIRMSGKQGLNRIILKPAEPEARIITDRDLINLLTGYHRLLVRCNACKCRNRTGTVYYKVVTEGIYFYHKGCSDHFAKLYPIIEGATDAMDKVEWVGSPDNIKVLEVTTDVPIFGAL